MATFTDLPSPARSDSDTEEKPEVYHDSNTNWQEIQEVKGRLSKLEAFDDEIYNLPLLNKEVKDQKDKNTKLEENIGGLYQKILDVEEYMKIIEKLETQSLKNMEMQLKLSTVMDKMEYNNQAMEIKIKELEDKEQRNSQEMGNQRRTPPYFTDKNKERELVNSKNSEPHRWEAGQGTFQDWRSLVEDHAERTQKGYKQTLRNIRQHKKEVTQEEWSGLSTGIEWEDKEKLHAFLKLKVSGRGCQGRERLRGLEDHQQLL